MKKLVSSLLETMQVLSKYMLDGNCLLLDPEYIFWNGQEIYFCYYPLCDTDPREEFHRLTEFFVREVDYKDTQGVQFAYTLHKATMEDNYSIAQIMEDFASSPEEEKEEAKEPEVDYTKQMETQSLEDMMVAEKIDFWEPVKKLLERKWRHFTGKEEE